MRAADAACGGLCGVYAAPHSHAQETNIPNIEDVEKIFTSTCEQAQGNKANAEQELI